MRLTRTKAPEVEPVTLAETKRHLRVDDPDDDGLIENLITAARQHVEEICRRQLLTATWTLSLPGFPAGGGAPGTGTAPWQGYGSCRGPRAVAGIRLPRPPCQEIGSVKYVDSDGAMQTMAPTDYTLSADDWTAEVSPAYGTSWPAARAVPEAVLVEYKAGYGLPAALILIASVDAAADTLTTAAAHNLATGRAVRFTTTGTLPAPLAAALVYYVSVVDADTVKVHLTAAAALAGTGAVDLTDAGDGIHKISRESEGADVPASIRAAILLLVGHLYENREATTQETLKAVPMAVDSLLAPYRVMEEF